MKPIPVLAEPMQATPIHELNHAYTRNRVYIKRDDLVPFSFGGNKARKARFFYHDIMEKQPNILVTYGSSNSNHCRIVANMAVALGIRCHIISPQERYFETVNSKLASTFGASVEVCPVERVSDTINQRIKQLKEDGDKPYFIMGGGHGNFGTAAYVEAYDEILRYEATTGIQFDYVFHASGTGTTQAGLVCGQIMAYMNSNQTTKNSNQKIVGISIARETQRGGGVIEESIRQYLDECTDVKCTDVSKYLIFVDTYRKGGYGEYDQQVLGTIADVMKYEGIPMDTTYVGKAFYGMNAYLTDQNITDKNVLFIHTGGTPLFFDEQKGK